jgi:cob(I)alamin adenosyltransferase
MIKLGLANVSAIRRMTMNFVISNVYTKTGDSGDTSLGDGSRVSKNNARIEAYATVDEANSFIGVALSDTTDLKLITLLLQIQNDLFDVGADLCTPVSEETKPLRVTEEQITYLESQIDEYNANLPVLRSFVLPSGTRFAADLHVARTVVRRAERATWYALYVYPDTMNVLAAKYLNRLSDLLFVLARVANEGRDILWTPGGPNAS